MLAQRIFFLLLLVAALGLMFFMLLPYLAAFVLAVTFAVLFKPLYRKFLVWTKGSAKTSALLTIFLIIAFVFTPLAFIGVQLFKEASQLYTNYASDAGSFSEIIAKFEQSLSTITPFKSIDIDTIIRQGASLLANNLGNIFSSALNGVVNFFIMIILLYSLFKDGPRFRQALVHLVPLEDHYVEQILEKLELAINSVIRGSLFIALMQGIVSAIGFSLFGVPEPLLWGSLAAITALIPSIGTALVLGPAILYLFFVGSTANAIGLLVWGMIAVGLIDNILGPYLIEKGINIAPVFILLAVLGGVNFFGPIGFLLGPLVLSLLFTLLDMYPLILKKSQ